jgi:hypothetical protein
VQCQAQFSSGAYLRLLLLGLFIGLFLWVFGGGGVASGLGLLLADDGEVVVVFG